jgi:cell division inhibitor SepF
MSALYRLKAYFGMVPAEELDDHAYFDAHPRVDTHDDYDYDPAYDRGRRNGHGSDWQPERRGGRGAARWSDDGADADEDYYDEPEPARVRRAPHRTSTQPPTAGWTPEAPVRGALAVDPNRDVGVRTRPAPAEEAHPLARITTLHPRTYNEARTIGEHYREGIPVIMNLTEMNDADAKRLVDFAAGLAFALRGSIDKVTTKVFLLSPPNIDVTAEDRRRIAEGNFLNRS